MADDIKYFTEADIQRIVRSVLHTERQTSNKPRPTKYNRPPVQAFDMVRGYAVTDVAPTDESFYIEDIEALGQNVPRPRDPLLVFNFPEAGFAQGDVVYAIYNHSVGQEPDGTGPIHWEVLLMGESGTSGTSGTSAGDIVAMLVEDVPLVSELDGVQFTAMPGILYTDYESTGAVVMRWAEPGEQYAGVKWVPMVMNRSNDIHGTDVGTAFMRLSVVNSSRTEIRASVQHPVLVLGPKERVLMSSGTGTGTDDLFYDDRIIVQNVMDFRALPGFGTSGIQIPFHEDGADNFKLNSEQCGTGS